MLDSQAQSGIISLFVRESFCNRALEIQRDYEWMPTATSEPPPLMQHVQAIRSDMLPHLSAFLQRIEVLKEQSTAFQIDLIVDANVVIGDLLWLATNLTIA